MHDIIPIFTTHFDGFQKQSINARSLHEFLEVKKDFSNWIKNRLKDFTENQDFIRFAQKVEANNATKIDYIITLDIAKHISMIERNEKGSKIRQYFIDFEKKIQQPQIDSRFLLQIAQEMAKKEELIERQRIVINVRI